MAGFCSSKKENANSINVGNSEPADEVLVYQERLCFIELISY